MIFCNLDREALGRIVKDTLAKFREKWLQTPNIPFGFEEFYEQLGEDVATAINIFSEDLDERNIGATICAQQLLKIAKTGEHTGVFGGQEVEEAAQAIVELHKYKASSIARQELANQIVADEGKRINEAYRIQDSFNYPA